MLYHLWISYSKSKARSEINDELEGEDQITVIAEIVSENFNTNTLGMN